MRTLSVFLVATALLLHGTSQCLWAEPPDPNKVQERVEFLTMWKMMEALDLDKSTAEKILELRKKFLSQRKTVLSSLHDNFRILQKILKDSPRGKEDTKELTSLLTQIRDSRKKLEALDDELYEQISQVLTVRQQAELILFLRDFRKELRGLMPPPLPPPPPHFGPGPGGPPPPFDPGMGPSFDQGLGPDFPRGDFPEKPAPEGGPGK